MQVGYLTLNDAGGIRPDHLASELEQRAFDSVWFPEHSHIPLTNESPYPGGADLPEGYRRTMDPFVSLALAASATTSIKLCTGVCLLLEHDLLALACATATLDVLSSGRLRLGVGVGWNRQELANHRPDVPFRLRYSAMRERVAALRVAWTEEVASFSGRWDRFSPSYVYPKPLRGSVPVLLGNAGPVGIEQAADYADGWCPIDASMLPAGGRPDPQGAVELFRSKLQDNGRDPAGVPISVFAMGKLSKARLGTYAELGVDRVVFPPPTMDLHSADDTLRHLDHLGEVVHELGF